MDTTTLAARPLTAALAAASLLACAGGAAAQGTVYADVVSSTPVTAVVEVPRRECADVERLVQRQPSGVGALVGAVAGGIIGNQFGGGSGRAAATVAGIVGGSLVGNATEANAQPYGAYTARDCRTVAVRETRVVGYDVVYDHAGQRHRVRMAQDPGPRLALDVRPAGTVYSTEEPRFAGRAAGRPVPLAAVEPSAYDDEGPTVRGVDSLPPVNYYEQAPVAYGQAAPTTVIVERPYGYHGGYHPYAYAAPFVGIGYWGGWGRGWHGHRHWHGGGHRHHDKSHHRGGGYRR